MGVSGIPRKNLDEESEIKRKKKWLLDEETTEYKLSEEEIDVDNLTQLPEVDIQLQNKLKEQGYVTLWEIAVADVDELARKAETTTRVAKNIIAAAKKFLGLPE